MSAIITADRAERLISGLESLAAHVPSPEGCGCADRKRRGLAKMASWIRQAAGVEELDGEPGDLGVKVQAVEAYVGALPPQEARQ